MGSAATLLDVLVLTVCIRLFGVPSTTARLPALVVGATAQFFGNRSYTFRAQGGNITRQAWLFIASEVLALAMNWSLFQWLAPRVEIVGAEVLSFALSFVVFVGFSYPLRKIFVFRVPEAEGDAMKSPPLR